MTAFADKPVIMITPDGRRLHLRHGPIELVIEAEGERDEVEKGYRQAAQYFQPVLSTLVGELDLLRKPVSAGGPVPAGAIARRMHGAAMVHADRFVTPMVAVAGAVADHVLATMIEGRALSRAFVNNGGDIALYLGRGSHFDIGICANPENGTMAGSVRICDGDPVRGIATSGWRGRSHSFGIADAVTVLACDAASADAAATMIANEVTLDRSANISRVPASDLAPDSDLGDRPVTVAVGDLSGLEIAEALDRGERAAKSMAARGLIEGAFLCLCGVIRIVGDDARPGLRQHSRITGKQGILEDILHA